MNFYYAHQIFELKFFINEFKSLKYLESSEIEFIKIFTLK